LTGRFNGVPFNGPGAGSRRNLIKIYFHDRSLFNSLVIVYAKYLQKPPMAIGLSSTTVFEMVAL
jgi:hypothetical protein